MGSIDHAGWIQDVLDENNDIVLNHPDTIPWIVVPVEAGAHFDVEDVRKIGKAMNQNGSTSMIAILLEEACEDSYFEFSANEDGLLDFNEKYCHFSVALFPFDHSFLMVCTLDDYFLIAGTEQFLQVALGTTIESARKNFRDFSEDESWPNEIRSFLTSIADRYSDRAK